MCFERGHAWRAFTLLDGLAGPRLVIPSTCCCPCSHLTSGAASLRCFSSGCCAPACLALRARGCCCWSLSGARVSDILASLFARCCSRSLACQLPSTSTGQPSCSRAKAICQTFLPVSSDERPGTLKLPWCPFCVFSADEVEELDLRLSQHVGPSVRDAVLAAAEYAWPSAVPAWLQAACMRRSCRAERLLLLLLHCAHFVFPPQTWCTFINFSLPAFTSKECSSLSRTLLFHLLACLGKHFPKVATIPPVSSISSGCGRHGLMGASCFDSFGLPG